MFVCENWDVMLMTFGCQRLFANSVKLSLTKTSVHYIILCMSFWIKLQRLCKNVVHKGLMAVDKETLDSDLWSVFLLSHWWSRIGIWDREPDPGLLLPSERKAAYGIHPPHTSIFHHHPPLLSPLLCWVSNGTLVDQWAVYTPNTLQSFILFTPDHQRGLGMAPVF